MLYRICCSVLLFAASAAAALPAPDQLRCEHLEAPVGIDAPEPRLSWVLPVQEGLAQEAYQVQVASAPEALQAGEADLWDSGRVESNKPILQPYAGKPLESNQRCFWRVRYWADGAASGWSETGYWSMGLLAQEDWQGPWIARDVDENATAAEDAPSLAGANWLWRSTEGDENHRRRFRRAFELPDEPIVRGEVLIAADDEYTLFVNGVKEGKDALWSRGRLYDVSRRLHPGQNVVAVDVNNTNPESPAGLAAKIFVETAGGQKLELVTDGEWKVQAAPQGAWTSEDYDDSGWPSARVVGEVGIPPWGVPETETERSTQPAPSPLLRKTFNIEKPVDWALLHVAGLGYHAAYVNGQPVSENHLDPAFTRYDKRVLYVSHDVADMLKQGENALGVMLGQGWYNMHAFSEWDFNFAPWRDWPRMRAQLHVGHPDGTQTVITSGEDWQTAEGPFTYDSIRVGAYYDARRAEALAQWTQPVYDASGWEAADVVEGPEGVLRAQMIEPVRVTEKLQPASVKQLDENTFLIDTGQNMTGWLQIDMPADPGREVVLRYSEKLGEDGRVLQHNDVYVYSEFQTERVTLGEQPFTWTPKFTYYGFQYVQVEHYPGKLTAADVEPHAANTTFRSAGSFSCSNELLNAIQQATLWSYRSNFVGYPLDCPHREKNGWTGDAHLAAELGLLNFQSAAAYTKWLHDFADEQTEEGNYAAIIPTSGWGYNIGPAWDSAYVLIPWYLFVYRGDSKPIAEHYPHLQRYLDYLGTRAEGHIVSYGLGDWVPVETQTPAPLTSTAFYYRDAELLGEMAALLGKVGDAARYRELAAAIKDAFNERFLNRETGVYANGSQTAQSCALYWDLAPEELRGKVFERLVEAVEARNRHIDTGILGAKWLLRVLSENGRTDLAYAVATQTDYPSWGHWIERGATTLWEEWDGEGSQNHVMFGDISAWAYRYLAGIQPIADAPGFWKFHVAPQPVEGLDWVEGRHESPFGPIVSRWERTEAGLKVKVQVPASTEALFVVPAGFAPSEQASQLLGVATSWPTAEGHGLTPGVHEFELHKE